MKPALTDKLAALRTDPNSGHFILADAKDADMAWGIASAGARDDDPSSGSFRSMVEFRQQMRDIVAQGCVDILLASTSTLSLLAHEERLFDSGSVTPAARLNDTTDVWLPRGSCYRESPSRPFATSSIEEVQFGPGRAHAGEPIVNLGLYSVTFNNSLTEDLATLEAFNRFRREAIERGFHYFLEVFPPNMGGAVAEQDVPGFMNDHICRMLAGVPIQARPEFLKIPYLGPGPLEELVGYDPSMIVGVLGGGSGTTLDAFTLLFEAQKHGAGRLVWTQDQGRRAPTKLRRYAATGCGRGVGARGSGSRVSC